MTHASTQGRTVGTSLGDELKSRLLIVLTFVLSLQLGDIISRPITDGVLYLIVASLLEVSIIIVIFRMFGDKSIARDINELNFYALLIHLIAIPLYLNKVQSEYHNWAMNGLFFLGLARLLYFGPRTASGDFKGLPSFGLLSYLRQQYALPQWNNLHSTTNLLPTICFFASAIPLWLITLRTNDPTISASVCVTMIFVFMLARNQTPPTQLSEAAKSHLAALSKSDVIEIFNEHALAQREDGSALTPRNVALQLMNAYAKTHPVMRNVSLAMMIKVARSNANSTSSQTLNANMVGLFSFLYALREMGKEQKEHMDALDIQKADLARLHLAIHSEGMFTLDEAGRVAFIDYVMQFTNETVPDTTLILAIDVLTTAWLHVILDTREPYMADYDKIAQMTHEFYMKFQFRVQGRDAVKMSPC